MNSAAYDYPANLQLAHHTGVAHENTIHLGEKQVFTGMIPRLPQAFHHTLYGGTLTQPVHITYLINELNIGNDVIGVKITDANQFFARLQSSKLVLL